MPDVSPTVERTRGAAVLLVLVVAMVSLGRVASGFEEDELQHLHSAWLVYHGSVPYRDYFDHHMPLFHLLLSPLAGLVGTRYGLLFVCDKILGAALALCICALFWRLAPPALGRAERLWALVLLAAAWYSDYLFLLRPDFLALLLLMLGAVLLLRGERPSPSVLALAGLCVGLATLCTQKSVVAVASMAAWLLLIYRPWRRDAFRAGAVALGGFLAGFAVPVGTFVGILASLGALPLFLAEPVGFVSHWWQPMTWRSYTQEPMLLNLLASVCGFAWALRSVVILARRGEETQRGDGLLGLLALVGLAAYLRTPAPTQHAFVFTTHVWLLACAVRFAGALSTGQSARGRAPWLLAATVGVLCLLRWYNAAAAALVCVAVWALVGRAAVAEPARTRAALVAMSVVPVLACGALAAERLAHWTVGPQLAAMRRIDGLMGQGTVALTTWPILTPARPHATYHWFSDIGMYTSMPREQLVGEFVRALKDRRTGAVVCNPEIWGRYAPEAMAELHRDYREAPIPRSGAKGLHLYLPLPAVARGDAPRRSTSAR